jgi:hypothetical protein
MSRDFEEQCLARVVEAIQSGEVPHVTAVIQMVADTGHPELADDILWALCEQGVNVLVTGSVR